MLDKGKPEAKVETEYTAAAAGDDNDYNAYEEKGLDCRKSENKKSPWVSGKESTSVTKKQYKHPFLENQPLSSQIFLEL